jgi:sulfur carrier protein
MMVTVNGQLTDVDGGSSVGDLVRAHADGQRQVAVARNSEVVPRGEWDGTPLSEGDLIEILAPVAGG